MTRAKKERAAKLAQANDLDGARSLFTQVVGTDPRDAAAWESLGLIHGKLGALDDAVSCFSKAIALRPASASAHADLGNALYLLGQLDQAVIPLQRAVRLAPGNATAFNTLALVLYGLGQLDAAAENLQKAVANGPAIAIFHANLGMVLRALGQFGDSLHSCRRAMEMEPQNEQFRLNFMESLQGMSFTSIDVGMTAAIQSCFDIDKLDHELMAGAVISLLKLDERVRRLIDLAAMADYEGLEATVLAEQTGSVFQNRLFRDLFRVTHVGDIDFEKLLTALRRQSLELLVRGAGAGRRKWLLSDTPDFIAAIACQCFNNEYVFSVHEDERERLAALIRTVSSRLQEPLVCDLDLQRMLLVVGMYEPLSSLAGSAVLATVSSAQLPEPVDEVIARQVRDYQSERDIQSTIPCITPISDAVSLAVKEQYEESPYPRWLNVQPTRPCNFTATLHSKFPHMLPGEPAKDPVRILIAGCGTGKHSIQTATRFPEAEILAVDLSRRSLAYAVRKTREFGIRNVTFAQADILSLHDLRDKFDLIESVGVLHHLKHPLDGWKVLAQLLRPKGVMRIGLYSARARVHIHKAQEYVRHQGFRATPDGIQRARQALLEADAVLAAHVTKALDFFSTSDCRDLLFHVQETCFSIPEIASMLKELGLVFLGFDLSGPRRLQGFHEHGGSSAGSWDLDKWQEFEQLHPETFLGMYQFWVQSSS